MPMRQHQAASRGMQTWAPTLAILGLLSCFGFIALEVVRGEPIAFDGQVMRALRDAVDASRPIGPSWLPDVARDITALGSTIVLGMTLLVVAGYLFAARKKHAGWLVLASVLGGTALNNLLKLAFARPRPDLVTALTPVNTLSFPSGHSASSAICYLTLGALVAQTHASLTVRIHVIAAATLLTVLVGFSRIYLGVHYPTDVLAGWFFGTAWALLCWSIMQQLQRRGEVELPED